MTERRFTLGIDPIDPSVCARTLRSIMDETSRSAVKTTRLPVLCEARDFVTGLHDDRGACRLDDAGAEG